MYIGWLLAVICGACALVGFVLWFIFYKLEYDASAFWTLFCALFMTVCFVTFVLMGIIEPKKGEKDYEQHKLEYEALSVVAVEYDDLIMTKQYENVSAEIVKRIINYNEWLSAARADKKVYGIASQYFYCDLDSMEFIGE